MVIGCCSIKFYLHESRSLKEKRRVVRAIKDRLKNNFNVSVAEVGDQDHWQSLHMGISAVGSDRPYMDGLMTKVVDAIDRMNLAEITDCKTETMNLGSGNFC
ncbi:MAG: DUF503 domain-containing protein [Nitrospina sp.]|jgi:uncharacterized protein|nr:DUF503 domain-containing protein [Nitrospina sp.]MBT3415480.1 DUF503 domain-containing protein [Nitrospina sp.]MBT3855871.1 DUF503 domain-containing protein [Nitrospina sp.]MBT4389253.1 DUF503 domain-containing protein [Nitrospina sp.]MBT4621715.1 DUF503 domain-containing protein [Nitrospina sp.]